MSFDIYPDRTTLAIILGVFVPGAGHIYWSQVTEWKLLKKGIKIIIITVIAGIVGNVVAGITVNLIISLNYPLGNFLSLISVSIITLFPALIWIWQIMDLLKILNINPDKKKKS